MPTSHPETSAPAEPARAVRRWLVFGNVMAVLLVAALASVALHVSHAALEQRAADAAENLASTLEQSIAARIEFVDLMLRSVALQHQQLQGDDAARWPVLAAHLEEQHSLVSGLEGLRLTDSTGDVRLGRGITPGTRVNLADREYFARARDNRAAGLVVSEPVFARISQKWVIALARRLERADGSFAGIVYANIASEEFHAMLDAVKPGSHGAVTLRTASLRLVARSTPQGTQSTDVGSANVSQALRDTLQKQPRAGTFVARTALDQIQRANAYRRIGDFPLYVLVGVGTADYLAPWFPEAIGIVSLATLLCLALAGASVYSYRAWRRGSELEREQLLRQRSELHAAELNQLLKERSTMIDVLAHEVRQPLHNAAVALQSAQAAMATVDEPVAAKRLARAEAVLGQVLSNIDNTLAVASLLGRAGPIARQDTDIDTFLELVIADMPVPERHAIRVERHTATRTASMDMGLMRLALRNLLSNALKYGPAGAPVVVGLHDSDDPLALLIDVSDSGPGVDAGLVPHIFERGTRGRHEGGPTGRGLGLHIVQRVMELHGGHAEIVRNTAQGITMRLVLAQVPGD